MNKALPYIIFYGITFFIFFGMHFYVYVCLNRFFFFSRPKTMIAACAVLALAFPVCSILERFFTNGFNRMLYAGASVWIGVLFLLLTAYYLLRALPDRKILLYGEATQETWVTEEASAVLLPNFAIEKVPRNSAELVFNSYSLAEMPSAAVNAYVREMTRIARQWVFHVNHTRNALVVADEFGFDPECLGLIYRAPAEWNAARNPDFDEFEFLYRKNQEATAES